MEDMYGIKYSRPEVVLMQDTGIGVAEAAARTCYDSFENSENESIKFIENNLPNESTCKDINSIEDSNLLDDLAWTYFHHSILEHANLSFLVRGTSRGVLQEHARHRMQAISVRSTRYTMSSVINAFSASQTSDDRDFFIEKVLAFDMFVTKLHVPLPKQSSPVLPNSKTAFIASFWTFISCCEKTIKARHKITMYSVFFI